MQNNVLTRVSSSDEHALNHDVGDFISAMRLASLSFPEFPVPLGIYYQKSREIFNLTGEVTKSVKDLPHLFRAKATWKQG